MSGVQTAGIALDSNHVVSGFVTNHAVEFPAFVPEIPAVFAAVASVRFIPQTVLRTPDGVVVFSWPGMMSDSLRSVVVTAARGRHVQP